MSVVHENVRGLHICLPIYGGHGLVQDVGLHKPIGLKIIKFIDTVIVWI
jgi:hypothetical protein